VSIPRTGEPLIVLRSVAKSYREGERERVVFRALDAEFARGETAAIVGPSGSGKSTLLSLMSGIDVPDAGEVRVDGVSLTGLGERERTLFRRRAIGFVFQFFNLIPTLNVEENLLLPLELLALERAAARARVRRLLAAVGLADRAASFPDRLSGGEQQRVAVARALVHEPALVLADEPTGNLDSDTGRSILDLLAALTGDGGRTLVLATHSAAAAAYADRVLSLEGGALRARPESGTGH